MAPFVGCAESKKAAPLGRLKLYLVLWTRLRRARRPYADAQSVRIALRECLNCAHVQAIAPLSHAAGR
jgi:hypothetical protein